MIGDLGAKYPVNVIEVGPMKMVIYLSVLILPFLVMYMYIRFVENDLNSIINSKIIPFIRYKIRLDGIINLINNILKIEIFNYQKRI
jgi:hypothetical protein